MSVGTWSLASVWISVNEVVVAAVVVVVHVFLFVLCFVVLVILGLVLVLVIVADNSSSICIGPQSFLSSVLSEGHTFSSRDC